MERNHSDLTSNFQAIRRAPMYPLSVATPDSSLSSPNPSRPMETKLDAQQNGKTEAVPVEFVYANLQNQANYEDALSNFEVPSHKNDQVGLKPTTVEPVRQSSPGMAKTKLKSNSVETHVSVSHQGRGQSTQKELFTSKDLDRAVEVALMTEPGASAVAGLEKAKSRTEMASPSKLAVGQTTGVRTNGNLKVESFPHGSTQERKVKPKPEKAKEKGEDVNDRASNYISRAKIRIRAMSNAGGTKGAGQKDSTTDHFGNYIQRAKMKIRAMSGIGLDKNVQSKRGRKSLTDSAFTCTK